MKRAMNAIFISCLVLLAAMPVSAQDYFVEDFETPGVTNGPLDGQNGWSAVIGMSGTQCARLIEDSGTFNLNVQYAFAGTTNGTFSMAFNLADGPFVIWLSEGTTHSIILKMEGGGAYYYQDPSWVEFTNAVVNTGQNYELMVAFDSQGASTGEFSVEMDGETMVDSSGATIFPYRDDGESINRARFNCWSAPETMDVYIDNLALVASDGSASTVQGFEPPMATGEYVSGVDPASSVGADFWGTGFKVNIVDGSTPFGVNPFIGGDDGGAVVQDAVAHGGSQALELQNATASRSFSNTASNGTGQVVFHAKPCAGEAPAIVPANACALFYVNASLNLVAYSNTVPVELAMAVDTNAWTEFRVVCDYAAQTWDLAIDGSPVVDAFPFHSPMTLFSDFTVVDESPAGCHAYIDDIIMTTPPDSDGDGLPDGWEALHYGGATNAVASAICSNGVDTVWQAYVAGFDPNDPASEFLISDFRSLASGSTLQWQSVSGRVYAVYWTTNLLDGFTVLQTNYMGGAFTDTVHAAEAAGFYRLEVDIE